MRISDWSSDVCSSDLLGPPIRVAGDRGSGNAIVTKKRTGLLLPLIAALTLAAPALAQDDGSLAQSSSPPERTSVLYTYGDEPCPEAGEGEIVVCAQRPESERYRVPKELREELKEEEAVGGGSWASTVEGYDNVARASRRSEEHTSELQSLIRIS